MTFGKAALTIHKVARQFLFSRNPLYNVVMNFHKVRSTLDKVTDTLHTFRIRNLKVRDHKFNVPMMFLYSRNPLYTFRITKYKVRNLFHTFYSN